MPCYILEYLSFQKNRMTIEEEIYYFYILQMKTQNSRNQKKTILRRQEGFNKRLYETRKNFLPCNSFVTAL